jgi:predicted dehydrogenase
MSKLRVVVLGLGFFGKNWMRELAACPECEVVGVVAKHPDLLASVGDEYKIPAARRFASIQEGLDRAGAQAAVVALPVMFHKEAILAALGHGLHVLTEKPLVLTLVEAAEVVRAARRAPGQVVMVDQNYRWRPQNQTLRRFLRAGKLGRLASATHEFCQPITRATTDAWREQMPYPYLHDMAPHHFDLLRASTGLECRELVAVGVRPPWNWYKGLPGVGAVLSFEGDFVVTYSGSMVARGFTTPQDGIITVVGEGGTLRLEADSQVRWYHDGQVELVAAEPMVYTDTAYTLREFLAAIREGRRAETHVEDNVYTLAMVEAAITSIETGHPAAVAPLVADVLKS